MFNLSNNAVPPVQFASDLDRMLSLLASVADPKASAERLQELNTAVQEAQVVIDGAAAVKAEIDLARGAVEQDKIDASKRLADGSIPLPTSRRSSTRSLRRSARGHPSLFGRRL